MRPFQNQTPYSYRDDASVPPVDDSYILAVMDGNCAFCSTGARMLSRLDRADRIRIAPSQSPLGSALMRHYGLVPEDPESWLVIHRGHGFVSFDASIEIGRALGWLGWLLQPLRLIPRPLRDWLYARIAWNRYSIFGRTKICAIPDPKLRARLIE